MATGDKTGSGMSRRGFLKGVGAGAVAGGIVHEVAAPRTVSAAAGDLVGPGKVPITLRINGRSQKLEVEPRVTLLDALRNRLDLTGSKKVCDRGTCGACSVLMDGRAVYACNVLAVEAEGAEITTVEGLGTPEAMHAVQEKFIEHDGLQCGFCTPGFVVACTDFLNHHPDAALEDVQKGLGGNLCRCGTYVGVTAAALDAAKAVKGGA
jgi:xanthine dehydrogenase YagT iron-sulfur-binding subunit